MRPMPTSRLSVLVLALAALGCREDPSGPAPAPDALLRCLGKASYPPGTMEGIFATLKADPHAFCGDTPNPLEQLVSGNTSNHFPLGGGRVRTLVLDAVCRPVADFETRYPSTRPGLHYRVVWDGRDQGGRPAPTGEYYLNHAMEFADGRKDTAYTKVGYIDPTRCP